MAGQDRRCEALVLRHTDYGESDRILTLLTSEYGVQKGFARSARNSRKRFGATVEPFTKAVFHWRSGRGDLWLLQSADLIDAHFGLRLDIRRLSLASYGVELVELLVEEGEAFPRIYELLSSFLAYLDQGGGLPTARLLLELRLTYLLGYIPHLLHCSSCLHIFNNEPIRFDAKRGGSLCLACADNASFEISLGTVGSLSRALNVTHEHFQGFSFGERTCRETQLMFDQVLGLILPREPKSLRFLEQL